jgi:hypothetical protein
MRMHIKKHVNITDIGTIKQYLGVNYKIKEDKNGLHIECEMQAYITNVMKDFEEYAGKPVKDYNTLGKPSYMLPKNEGDIIDESDYRCIIGKALFAIRKVGTNCANAIQDLSSHLSNPGKEHWAAVASTMSR